MKHLLVSFLLLVTACGSPEARDEVLRLQSGGAREDDARAPGEKKAARPDSFGDEELAETCYQGDEWSCAVEAAIVAETNVYRMAAPLGRSFPSDWVARQWSIEQGTAGSISHDGFPKARNQLLLQEFPSARWRFYAENVAQSNARGDDPDPLTVAKGLVDMWYNSPGHKANMMNTSYRFMGAGVHRVGSRVYATQIFY